MPVVSGRLVNKAENASSPPAEAPMPTTGKNLPGVERGVGVVEGGAGEDRRLPVGVERFFNVRNSTQPGDSGEKGQASDAGVTC